MNMEKVKEIKRVASRTTALFEVELADNGYIVRNLGDEMNVSVYEDINEKRLEIPKGMMEELLLDLNDAFIEGIFEKMRVTITIDPITTF